MACVPRHTFYHALAKTTFALTRYVTVGRFNGWTAMAASSMTWKTWAASCLWPEIVSVTS